MPPPAFLENSEVPPITADDPGAAPSDPHSLDATFREPAPEISKDRFYTSSRATELRLGSGRVVLDSPDVTWAEARRMSNLKNCLS